MPSLDGIIITTADGTPILHSHFHHPLPTYPLLHLDHLNSRIANSNQDDSSVEPLLWVPGIPSVSSISQARDQVDLTEPPPDDVWRNATSQPSDLDPVDSSQFVLKEQALNSVVEQGAALVHVDEGYLRFLCPVSSESEYLGSM